MVTDLIYFVGGAVAAVAVPAVFKFVAKQLGWLKAEEPKVVAAAEAEVKKVV